MVTFEETPAAPSALELAGRRFHEHQIDEPLERIAELISEDAEMKLLVAHLRLLRGKHAIMAALEEGREAEMYAAKVDRCELLDEETLLVAGHARYAAENGGVRPFGGLVAGPLPRRPALACGGLPERGRGSGGVRRGSSGLACAGGRAGVARTS